MEIELFWKRSNYFLCPEYGNRHQVLLRNFKIATMRLSLLFLGAIVSGLWFLVNLGSKFSRSRWEYRSSVTERSFANDADLFCRV